jgi:hypothetical protein
VEYLPDIYPRDRIVSISPHIWAGTEGFAQSGIHIPWPSQLDIEITQHFVCFENPRNAAAFRKKWYWRRIVGAWPSAMNAAKDEYEAVPFIPNG